MNTNNADIETIFSYIDFNVQKLHIFIILPLKNINSRLEDEEIKIDNNSKGYNNIIKSDEFEKKITKIMIIRPFMNITSLKLQIKLKHTIVLLLYTIIIYKM